MKNKSIALFMATCLLLPFAFTACEDSASTNDEKENKDLICSFESVEEVLTLNAGDVFGKKQFSDNTSYVTDGKGCLYVEITKDFDYINRESIWGLDTKEEFVEPHLMFSAQKFGLSDVAGVYGFAIDVYNASEKDVPVELTMQTDVDGAMSYYDMDSQTAFKDKASTLYFTADATTLQYNGIEELTNVYLTFPFVEGDEAPIKLYLDNFRLLRGEVGKTSPYTYEGTMLCGFESIDVVKRITVGSFYTVKDYWAKASINTDSEYVTEGSSSLKLTRGYTNYITTGRSGKGMVTLSNANFFKDTPICDLPVEDISRLVVKVDVYNDAPTTEVFEYFIGPRIKEPLCMFRTKHVPAKTWTTLELSVAQIVQEYVEKGREAIDLRELFLNFAFSFSFRENTMNSKIVTYVDNLRYELT